MRRTPRTLPREGGNRPGYARRQTSFLVGILHFLELGVHHVIAGGALGAGGLSLLGLFGIELLRQVGGGFRQLGGGGLDGVLVVALDGVLDILDGGFDGGLLLVAGLVARLAQGLAHGVGKAIGGVAGLHQLLELLVLGGVGLGVAHHLLDLVLTEAGGCLDDDGLLLAGGLVLGGHVENTVGIDVEGHLDLRHAAGRRRNVGEVEAAQGLVLGRLLALTLNHMNGHGGLVVVGGGEHLGLLGGNGGVLLDQRGG